jgi:acyl CoA:acetate/3-ketoacid CoA transferase beta subunit
VTEAREEELKHLLTPSPATIAQFIQNALSCIQSHEEDLLDLHSAPLDAGVEVHIVDGGQVKLKIKVFVVT